MLTGNVKYVDRALDPFPWTPSERCAGKFWGSSTDRDDTPRGARGGWVRLPTASPNGDALGRSRVTPVHGCRIAKSCGVTLFGSEPQRCQLVTTTTTGGFNSRFHPHGLGVAKLSSGVSVVLLARNDSSNPAARIFDIAAPTRNQVDMRVEHGLPRVGPDIDSQVETPDIWVTR